MDSAALWPGGPYELYVGCATETCPGNERQVSWRTVVDELTKKSGAGGTCNMRDLVFAVELRGQAAPVEGRKGVLQATTAGRGPMGETVTFTSEVVLSGETFTETGRIEYGGRGSVQFDTVGAGYLGPSPLPETQWGVISWRITSGDGEFQGASGYITSNFTVGASGDVVDNHYVRMVFP